MKTALQRPFFPSEKPVLGSKTPVSYVRDDGATMVLWPHSPGGYINEALLPVMLAALADARSARHVSAPRQSRSDTMLVSSRYYRGRRHRTLVIEYSEVHVSP